jgi:hypothetical protein
MTENILRRITADRITRVDMNFKIGKRTLDSVIGRTAHIEFIENERAVRMLVDRYIN